MATLQVELRAELETINTNNGTPLGASGARIYPQSAPRNVTRPYVVYTRISENDYPHLTGQTGLADATYQLTFFGDNYNTLMSVCETYRFNLNGFTGDIGGGSRNVRRCILRDERDLWVDKGDGSSTSVYGIMQEYEFYYIRATS